ncbi:MAG: hypothetical protein IJU10_02500, partial [Clostridia bacterium]|nr:hypothetical protein [Clostridia bacterium]
ISGDNGVYDLYYSAKLGDELQGIGMQSFSTQIGNALSNLRGDAGYKIDGIYAVLADGSKKKVLNEQSSFVSRSAETLNDTDYYLDDAKKICLLEIGWTVDSYKLYFTGWNNLQNGEPALIESKVAYWETVLLSQQFDQSQVLMPNYVHIGWTTNEDEGSWYVSDADLTANEHFYTKNAQFRNDNTAKTAVILYAVWGVLPSAPASENCKVEGLRISLTPNDPLHERVDYRYVSDSGNSVVLPLDNGKGDLRGLDKNKTYTIYADVYRYYTTENIEARSSGVYSINVKPIDKPNVYVEAEKVGATVTNHSKVTLVIDDVVRGTLYDLEEEDPYFLRKEMSGTHRMCAYTSYIETYADNTVLCQSEIGDIYTFTIRDGWCRIVLNAGSLRLEAVDCVPVSVSNYNISATLNMRKGGVDSVKTFDSSSNFNKNALVQLLNASTLVDGDYILCNVLLLGSDGEISNALYAEVRRIDGALIIKYQDANGQETQIIEE